MVVVDSSALAVGIQIVIVREELGLHGCAVGCLLGGIEGSVRALRAVLLLLLGRGVRYGWTVWTGGV